MIKKIKNFFNNIFKVRRELTAKEEQMLVKEIFKKIKESE